MKSYRDHIEELAEHPDADSWLRPRELPLPSLELLSAAMNHYPDALAEAVASDQNLRTLCARTLEQGVAVRARCYTVGMFVTGALSDYLRPILLRDIQQEVERQRSNRAAERNEQARRFHGGM
jgi:hypothetical protein